MNIMTRVYNHATQWMKKQSALASQTMSKAVKASGFELMRVLKEGMKREAPSNERWPITSPWTKYKLLEKSRKKYARREEKILRYAEEGKTFKARKVRRLSIGGQTTALKKLASAARVKSWVNMYPGGQSIKSTKVHTGFINDSASRWAAYHMSGPHVVPVTPKMRRMIFAAGLIIKAGQIKIPKRRHTEPVYERNQNVVADFINKRVAAAMRGLDPKSVRVSWH